MAAYRVLAGIRFGQGVVGFGLLQPDEVGGVAVEGRVGVGVLEQVEQRAAEGFQGPGRAPIGFDDVEADLASDEVDVGVEDLGLEVELGRGDRVIGGEADLDEEDVAGVRSVARPFDEGLPGQQVVLVEHQQELVELLLGGLDGLLHQSLLVHQYNLENYRSAKLDS